MIMTKIRGYSISFLFFLASACALPVLAQNVASLNPDTNSSVPLVGGVAHALQISAGDLLDVNVFDTAELSGRLRVNERGSIALPIAGDVVVSGLTADQTGHAIEQKLLAANILKDPHVSVTVLEYATQGVTVLGEVKNPGVYPLLGTHGLLDLISAAGGVTPNAGKGVTVTHRTDPDHPEIVNMQSKPGSTVGFNVDVRPGDTIVVSHAGIIYVVGEVGKPGGFMIENNDRLTVLQAIALAQGTTRTAALNHAKLIRKTGGTPEEFPVPLKKILRNSAPDQILADGDILFVPSGAAQNALRDVESILPAAASAMVYHIP
jgi:polysaccharide export outer membrane protein